MSRRCHSWACRFAWIAALVWTLVAVQSGRKAGAETVPSSERALSRRASSVLAYSSVRGGLLVHLGCGDGRFTAALAEAAGDAWLVQGLDSDAENVAAARRLLAERGLYGRATVERLAPGRLPYADNLASLVVVEDPAIAAEGEILRVLRPGGVLVVNEAAGRVRRVEKPWPSALDEWTHFLHDSSGNAVSHDARVAPPNSVQWRCGPAFTRDHDALASFSAMTSSNGRLFYILDEGPTSIVHRPPQWRLIARDAFSGVLLWKREIPEWITHLYYFRSGPAHLPRRLVSEGDRVYVTLGLSAPISMLDAATGRTLRTYPDSAGAEEILVHNGVLLGVVNEPRRFQDEAPKVYGYWELLVDRSPTASTELAAWRADTGEPLWRKSGGRLDWLAPLSLCAAGGRVYYLDDAQVHCLDLETGREQWAAAFSAGGLFLRNYAPTVVVCDDVLLCMTWKRLAAFAVADGRKLWEQKGAIGFASPGDLFVIDGLVWTVPMTASIWWGNQVGPDGKIKTGVPIPTDEFIAQGEQMVGLDLHTGQVKRSLPKKELLPGGHHHRCYRNKATERYLICGRRGLEYVDLKDADHVNNWWVRGVCQYGVMPANGLLYAPPEPCQCFNFIKLNGFYALAREDRPGQAGSPPFEKGPAYEQAAKIAPGAVEMPAEAPAAAGRARRWSAPRRTGSPDEWPTFRGDPSRSGSTPRAVSADVAEQWRQKLGGRLTAPVVAGGRVYVGDRDGCAVHCLDAATGHRLWRFLTGGPVDSPPTIADGLCVFGCRDGWVYAVTAAGGELAWRFRAAPGERRIVADERLESAWPVHGAVLVQDGVVYFAAGRSSYLDGGVRLYGLELATGRKRYATSIAATPVRPGEAATPQSEIGALSDVLVSDGQRINMRQVQFDRRLRPFDVSRLTTLCSTLGLLDDSWHHRQNWVLGWPQPINVHAHAGRLSVARGASVPFGKLVAFDAQRAVAVQNPYTRLKYTPALYPPSHQGHLHQKYATYHADDFPVGVVLAAWRNGPAAQDAQGSARSRRTRPSAPEVLWSRHDQLQARAILLAGDLVFLAGWLDRVAIGERTGEPLDPDDPDPRPARLRVLRADSGELAGERPLPCEPVFDGMAAAYGRLYLSLQDGSLACWGRP